jgi:xanthine dehydrogenase accessory factor
MSGIVGETMNIQAERATRAPTDIWETVGHWLAEHGQAALATVISAWGSAPVPPGGMLVIAPGDRFEGSVSGGCVEVDVLVEAADAMEAGKPRLLEYGVSDETAWRAGLACGGIIKVLVEPLTRADIATVNAIIEARRARKPILVTTRLADGSRQIYPDSVEMPARYSPFLASGIVGLSDDAETLARPVIPPLRIIVAGATHVGQVFAQMARLAGYSVSVVDPRPMFASAERFGTIALPEWPEASFDNIGLDQRTAVVALTHAAHIDDEALAAALRSPCIYIGALGSRVTHTKRLERMKAAGFSDEELSRIHAPIGLSIGAKGPAEIAVSILAEIVQVTRRGA